MKLRVSLDNLLAAEQVGRWWIVGSSWSGAPMINEDGKINSKQNSMEDQVALLMCWNCQGFLFTYSLRINKSNISICVNLKWI